MARIFPPNKESKQAGKTRKLLHRKTSKQIARMLETKKRIKHAGKVQKLCATKEAERQGTHLGGCL